MLKQILQCKGLLLCLLWFCIACPAEKGANTKQENPREENPPIGQTSQETTDGDIASDIENQSSTETDSAPPSHTPQVETDKLPEGKKAPAEVKVPPPETKVSLPETKVSLPETKEDSTTAVKESLPAETKITPVEALSSLPEAKESPSTETKVSPPAEVKVSPSEAKESPSTTVKASPPMPMKVSSSVETKVIASHRKVEFSRADPPPRLAYAEEDLEILREHFYSDNANMTKGFKYLAKVFHFDGFRAVPSVSVDSSEPHRVLLLGFSIEHLHETLNFFAALAKSMHEEGSAADDRNLSSLRVVPVVSLQRPPPAPDGAYRLERSKIFVQIDATHSTFIKQVPLNEKMQKFWPEALQLEMTFGGDRILFIFPSVIMFRGIRSELLEGKTLFQTPWILRALEGENLKALWQAVSGFEVDATDIQMGSNELLYKVYSPNLFESIWDERSEFFPKHNAFRIVGKFAVFEGFPGTEFFGYKSLATKTVGGVRSTLANQIMLPTFTFKTTK